MGKTRTRQRHTFADKFRAALAAKKKDDPNYGVRTVARGLARGDRARVDTIRRRLNKYLGPEAITPTEPTRHEIEAIMGLDRDALKPDGDDEEEDPAMRLRRIRAELVLLGREDLADDLKLLTHGVAKP